MKDHKLGPTIRDRSSLANPVDVDVELVEVGNVVARRYVRLKIEGPSPTMINLAVANLLSYQARALAVTLENGADELEFSAPPSDGIAPGARVEVKVDLESPESFGFPAAPYKVKRGDRGWVVRLIHCRVEGEPIDGPTINPIVHVRFGNETKVVAFARECLRVVGDDAPENPS
jgi:hypothetical protein